MFSTSRFLPKEVLSSSLDAYFAHVAYIKQACLRPDGVVLVQDSRILNRHIEASKWHHLGAERDVTVMEGRSLEVRRSRHSTFGWVLNLEWPHDTRLFRGRQSNSARPLSIGEFLTGASYNR